jgi:hypothetical protein
MKDFGSYCFRLVPSTVGLRSSLFVRVNVITHRQKQTVERCSSLRCVHLKWQLFGILCNYDEKAVAQGSFFFFLRD